MIDLVTSQSWVYVFSTSCVINGKPTGSTCHRREHDVVPWKSTRLKVWAGDSTSHSMECHFDLGQWCGDSQTWQTFAGKQTKGAYRFNENHWWWLLPIIMCAFQAKSRFQKTWTRFPILKDFSVWICGDIEEYNFFCILYNETCRYLKDVYKDVWYLKDVCRYLKDVWTSIFPIIKTSCYV